MSERIDHAAEARRLREDAEHYYNDWHSLRCLIPNTTVVQKATWAQEGFSYSLTAAQVDATLALVEQQRIANLIALLHVPKGLLPDGAHYAIKKAFPRTDGDMPWDEALGL